MVDGCWPTGGATVADRAPPPPPGSPTLKTRKALASVAGAAAEAVPACPSAGAATGTRTGRSAVRPMPSLPPPAAGLPEVAATTRVARPRRRRTSAAASATAPRGGVERPPRRRRPAAGAPSLASSAARRPRPATRAGAAAVGASAGAVTPPVVEASPPASAGLRGPRQTATPQPVALPHRTSRLPPGTGLITVETAAAAANPYVVQVPFASAGVMMLMSRAALAVGSHGSFRYEVVANEAGSPVFNVNAEGGLPRGPAGTHAAVAPPPLDELPTGVPPEVLASLPVRTFGEATAAAAAAVMDDDDGAVTDVDTDEASSSSVEAVGSGGGGGGGCGGGSSPHTSCVICLADYAAGDELLVVPCGHAFHAAPCADRWFADALACPVCRAPVVSPPAGAPLPPVPMSPPTPPPPPTADAAAVGHF